MRSVRCGFSRAIVTPRLLPFVKRWLASPCTRWQGSGSPLSEHPMLPQCRLRARRRLMAHSGKPSHSCLPASTPTPQPIVDQALAAAPPGAAGWLLPVEPTLRVSAHAEIWASALARLRTRGVDLQVQFLVPSSWFVFWVPVRSSGSWFKEPGTRTLNTNPEPGTWNRTLAEHSELFRRDQDISTARPPP